MNQHPTLTELHRLLDYIGEYVILTRNRGDGLEIVMFVDKAGKIGKPKVIARPEPTDLTSSEH